MSKGKQRKDFFTIPEYEEWLEDTPDAKKWDSKYYKVCGSEGKDERISDNRHRVWVPVRTRMPEITSAT